MELYLLRHGDAARADPAHGIPDGLRPLTPEGARAVEAVAEALQRAGIRPDVVYTSPLRRCVETAEIAARVLGVAQGAQQRPALAPGCDLDAVSELLHEAPEADRVILVGHNPDFSQIAADLTGKDVNLDLAKGGLARVDLKGAPRRRKGELVWVLTPRLFL